MVSALQGDKLCVRDQRGQPAALLKRHPLIPARMEHERRRSNVCKQRLHVDAAGRLVKAQAFSGLAETPRALATLVVGRLRGSLTLAAAAGLGVVASASLAGAAL